MRELKATFRDDARELIPQGSKADQTDSQFLGLGEDGRLVEQEDGAGRVMSRRQARDTYRWGPVQDYLKHRNVRLLSAGLDEVPFVYKDINEVMAHQTDLVDILGRFNPRLVKMAPAGERPED